MPTMLDDYYCLYIFSEFNLTDTIYISKANIVIISTVKLVYFSISVGNIW